MRSWLLTSVVLIRGATSTQQQQTATAAVQRGLKAETDDNNIVPPNNLTGSWRLFVDHSNIASADNVHRVNHQFTRHPGNPVITEALLYGTVLPAAVVPAASQQDRYWMWYSVPDAFAFGIATSADGLVWDRPALCAARPGCAAGGVCKRCGVPWSNQTALVYDKAHSELFFTRTNSNSKLGGLCTSLNATRGAPSCCRDTDLSVVYTPWDLQKKFKMFNFNYGQDKEPAHDADGYYSAHSNDGATFHDDVATNPALPASGAGNPNDPGGPENHGDVSNFNFDFHTTEYFATIKQFFVINTSTGWTKPRRSVGVSRTRNYTSWPLPTKAIVVDELDESWTKEKPCLGNHTELYGLSAFAYETAYLGFLWVAHFNDHTDGTIEVELVSSSDGVNWTRAPAGPDGLRPAVLPRGLSPHASTGTAWDGMMVFTPNHPLVEGPEIKLFYEGCSNSHHGGADKCGVGIATMRQHGFVSLAHSGQGEPGIIHTTPIAASSYREGHVRINYRNTSNTGGTIRVAALEMGADGATIMGTQRGRAVEDCAPMRGDDLNRSVVWNTGGRVLPLSSNASLVLKFVLSGDVELFSFSLKTDDDDSAADRVPTTTMKRPHHEMPRWHTLEFGANIGYLGDPSASATTIRTAAAEGVITKLRAFEPWPAGQNSRWSPATAAARSAGWLVDVLNADAHVELLVSLSNYPFMLPANFTTDPAAFLEPGFPPDLLQDVVSMARYTNRAALFAAEGASPAAYAAQLAKLVSEVAAAGQMARVQFEIGNEPNALLYFWGSVGQFASIADASHSVLAAASKHPGGRPPMCCGYASAGSTDAWANPGWQAWSQKAPLRYPGSALSWHLYLNNGSSHPETYATVKVWARESGRPDFLNGSSITEFGLHSSGDATVLSVLNTPRLVVELAKLLAFCWETGVASVFYESLGDHPHKHGEYMGLFDKWGVPKLSYSYLRLVQSVVATGYTVLNSSEALRIIGRNRTLVLAHVDSALVLGPNSSVVGASAAYDGAVLPQGEWIITCETP